MPRNTADMVQMGEVWFIDNLHDDDDDEEEEEEETSKWTFHVNV